jgi:hypothetical protein
MVSVSASEARFRFFELCVAAMVLQLNDHRQKWRWFDRGVGIIQPL